jgi:hypothetical protein
MAGKQVFVSEAYKKIALRFAVNAGILLIVAICWDEVLQITHVCEIVVMLEGKKL